MRHLVEGRHELVLGVEGHLADAREDAPRLVDVHAALLGEDDERRLGRVADDLAVAHRRVVRQGHRQEVRLEGRVAVAGDAEDLALRRVALALDVVATPDDDQLARGHLVEGQRPRLVGANRGRRTERLDGAQPLDDRALRRERLRAERQHRRHDGGQARRDRGDREADPDQEQLVEVLAADQPEEDHERQGARGHDRDEEGELVELARERRLLLLHLAEHPGDLADLGRHPRRRDHHLAAATSHGRVHVRHVEAVAERDLVARHGVHGLQHGRALARQRRLLDLERRRQDQAAVGGDLVAGLERHHVAGNELLGGDVHALAVPAGVRMDQEHFLERGDALGGLALLVQAEDGVEHRQADDHDPGRPLLERDHADDRCAEQDELHEVAVLAEERVPAGLLLPLRELVRPDLRAAPVDLGCIEARTGIHAELCQRVRRGQSVPVCVSPAVDDCRHRSILKVRRRRRNRQGAPA